MEKRKVETIPSHTTSSLWRCYDAVVLDNLEDLEKKKYNILTVVYYVRVHR